MSKLERIVAGHPLGRYKPYNAIKFARFDGMGTPLYTVAKVSKEMGAEAALGRALELLGGKCFHCAVYMPPQKLSQECNRDHLRSKRNGGGSLLHNLVISCGPCNRGKAALHVVDFKRESAIAYFEALDEHLVRCIRELGKNQE